MFFKDEEKEVVVHPALNVVFFKMYHFQKIQFRDYIWAAVELISSTNEFFDARYNKRFWDLRQK